MSDKEFTPPTGFIEVSRADFYARINPLDVVLRSERTYSTFETRSREPVGYTTPGYMRGGRAAFYLRGQK